MPIRSPHGRSAAYRGLWQWPLRSPARLVATVAVVIAVVIGVTTALTVVQGYTAGPAGPGAAPPGGAAVPTSPATVAPTPSVLPPVPTNVPSAQPVSTAPTEVLQLARQWTQAWVRPPEGTSTAEWLDGLRPYTTEAYLGVLTAVDPSNNPATRVVGGVRAVSVTSESVQVEVPTDAVRLLVLVALTEDGWRVSGHERAA